MHVVRTALKVMPPILSRWSVTSQADVGGMAVEVESSHQYSVIFCCRVTDGSRGLSDKTVSDMEVCMKQRCVVYFIHVEKYCIH